MENERDFALRIQAQAARLGQAFTGNELITSYLNGMPESIRTYISSTSPNASTITQIQIAAYNAGKTFKSKPASNISNITIPQVRKPSWFPAPIYAYQPLPDSRTINTQPTDQPQRNANPKSCFVCSKDYYLHECPTLSEEQRKHALKANERFGLQKQQRDMLRKYNGNVYQGERQSNYLLSENNDVLGIEGNESLIDESPREVDNSEN
jgi:hypothetical protein